MRIQMQISMHSSHYAITYAHLVSCVANESYLYIRTTATSVTLPPFGRLFYRSASAMHVVQQLAFIRSAARCTFKSTHSNRKTWHLGRQRLRSFACGIGRVQRGAARCGLGGARDSVPLPHVPRGHFQRDAGEADWGGRSEGGAGQTLAGSL